MAVKKKGKDLSADVAKDAQDQIQKFTEARKEIDELVAKKEKGGQAPSSYACQSPPSLLGLEVMAVWRVSYARLQRKSHGAL